MRLPAALATSPTTRRAIARERPTPRRVLAIVVTMAIALIVTTTVVAFFEDRLGIDDASPVYLLAVVAVGSAFGTIPAVATALIAFVTYDAFFTEPRLSFEVADPREWLDLLLFLVVAIAIGRLVAVQRARADEAAKRAAEASDLFAISRTLATAPSTAEAASELVARVRDSTAMERVWIVVGSTAPGRLLADSGDGSPPASATVALTLVRTPGDEPARWVRTHASSRGTAGAGGAGSGPRRPMSAQVQYRVAIELDGEALGTVFATRDRALGDPDRSATRVLALTADQVAVALRRDELRRTATDLEVDRQADVLKGALIDAVSHDLRTPLASIRATAGGLADPAVPWTDEERRAAARVIDAEATRLDRLVGGLLELRRIATGAVHPDLEAHELWDVVTPAVERLRPALGDRPVTVDVPATLPPVLTDAVLLDLVVTNLIENVIAHTPPDAPLAIVAGVEPDDRVALSVADGGPGVAPDTLPTLFERFSRGPATSAASRRGLGIGLSVVRGLVEAMGGEIAAERSPLGGLAVTVRLRCAPSEATG
jgi:two-component system sensor histidine kinase KdpD